MGKKLISIMSNCFNEEENIVAFHKKIKEIMMQYEDKYDYEHIFMDNCSTDRTVELVKEIIEHDKNVKLIVNARNFGQVRSPYHGLLQTSGDASISLATDFQDPPELIPEFITKWEEGYSNVIGLKNKSNENWLIFLVRKVFYRLIAKISDTELIKNFTGFGLYDKKFLDVLRDLDEPYPYFRGLVAELGFNRAEVPYRQPMRKRGRSKNNLFTLYELAMIGFVNYTKLPLRLASFIGFAVSLLSLLIAAMYFVYKLLYWHSFQVGTAPIVIGLFLFGGIQLFFLGVIGEYIGAIFTQVKKRPLVVEKERVNF